MTDTHAARIAARKRAIQARIDAALDRYVWHSRPADEAWRERLAGCAELHALEMAEREVVTL